MESHAPFGPPTSPPQPEHQPSAPHPHSPAPQQLPSDAHAYPVVPGYNTLAIIGLVMSIAAPPIGIVISVLAIKDVKKTGQQGHGLAVAGIAISAVQMVLFVVAFVVLMALSMLNNNGDVKDYNRDTGLNTTSTAAQARDVQRKTDVSKLQAALEAYYIDYGVYPTDDMFVAQEWAKPYASDWEKASEAFTGPDGKAYTYDVSSSACTAKGCDTYGLWATLEVADQYGSKIYFVESEAEPGLQYQEN